MKQAESGVKRAGVKAVGVWLRREACQIAALALLSNHGAKQYQGPDIMSAWGQRRDRLIQSTWMQM